MTTRGKKLPADLDDDLLFKELNSAPKGSLEEENQRLREKLKYAIWFLNELFLCCRFYSSFNSKFEPKKILTNVFFFFIDRLAKEKLDSVRADRNALQMENELLLQRLHKIHTISEYIPPPREEKKTM